ncbi:hypothetical protein, partial [Yoonia sp.]|uniref:hypothetical protein n=1 Tax=Yoonia sp. TaxID=2212373 RepID=UPI002FDA939E
MTLPSPDQCSGYLEKHDVIQAGYFLGHLFVTARPAAEGEAERVLVRPVRGSGTGLLANAVRTQVRLAEDRPRKDFDNAYSDFDRPGG